jgi:transcriptional regulator with XRE-family HTH domain
MKSLLQQIKERRLFLGLKQNDMPLRIGVSRQQYQRLEAKGNPRLDTLELIAKGLNSEIMLIPREKLSAVIAVLDEDSTVHPAQNPYKEEKQQISDDPWAGLLGEDA